MFNSGIQQPFTFNNNNSFGSNSFGSNSFGSNQQPFTFTSNQFGSTPGSFGSTTDNFGGSQNIWNKAPFQVNSQPNNFNQGLQQPWSPNQNTFGRSPFPDFSFGNPPSPPAFGLPPPSNSAPAPDFGTSSWSNPMGFSNSGFNSSPSFGSTPMLNSNTGFFNNVWNSVPTQMEDITFGNAVVQVKEINTPYRQMNIEQLNMQQLQQELQSSRQVITNLVGNLCQAKNIFELADNQMKQVRQENEQCKSLIRRAQEEFQKLTSHDHELTVALQRFTQENQRLSIVNQKLDAENHTLAVRAIGKEVSADVQKEALAVIAPKAITLPSVDS